MQRDDGGLAVGPWCDHVAILPRDGRRETGAGERNGVLLRPTLRIAKRGAGEGLFGSFQVAGSVGFLTGPLVGGVLVETLHSESGAPAWAAIFAGVGILLSIGGLVSYRVLGPVAQSELLPAPPGRHGGSVNVPNISPDVDARGNALTRAIAVGLMRLFGWKFSGERFPDITKFVVIVAPHTSNWDFPVGVMAMYALGIRGTFLGKDTLFRFPMGIVMRWLGGIPVDRSSKQDVVTQTATLAQQRDRVIIVLSPEGTRKATKRASTAPRSPSRRWRSRSWPTSTWAS